MRYAIINADWPRQYSYAQGPCALDSPGEAELAAAVAHVAADELGAAARAALIALGGALEPPITPYNSLGIAITHN